MQVDQRGAAGSERDDDWAEIAKLRATCRRQAWAIETVTRVLANLRRGVAALKAENAELRALNGRATDLRAAADVGWAPDAGERVEACVPLDVHAPGAARLLVGRVLGERVAAVVLERAKLVMSELVTNSVRHSGGGAGANAVFRVGPVASGFRLEVEDSGRDGALARHAASPETAGGFGLLVVDALSERWGIERRADGGARAWAQLSDAAPYAGSEFGDAGEAMQPHGGRAADPRCPELHVIPEPRAGTWGVYVDAAAAPLSEHTSETEAESAARAHMGDRDGGGIVIHDRYHRTHARPLGGGN
jgi:serine/threonine-protein kinase RsbW